jgi:hypothetical protein
MKRVIIVLAMAAMIMASCGNRKVFNTQYQYDHAIIYAPDGAKVAGG